jgi:cobalt-zinc-cadmium efflux system outer membrane protein
VNGAQCSPWVNSIGISDSAAIEDYLSGKRDLRIKVALAALAATKMVRADVERGLVFAVKAAYVNVVQAVKNYKFAKENVATNKLTLSKFEAKYNGGKGIIDEGALERVRTQELEAEQALDNAQYGLRSSQVVLAFLLGVRGAVPDFAIDEKLIDFSVPPKLDTSNEGALTKLALDHRPDLLALGYSMDSASANISLNKLKRFPDIAIGLNYTFGGFGGLSTNGPAGPQVLSVSLTVPIPVFYQLDGEIMQAEAQYDATALLRAKTTAQVINDVALAYASYVTTRKLVERMEGPRRDGGGLLESATVAFDKTTLQYDKGAASLTDFLDALRTYIATKLEYFDDLANYWTAVYQVEQAVGMDLR